jgi:hypothetical protein
MTAEEKALFGIDKLNVARSEIPAVTHVHYSAWLQTVPTETQSSISFAASAFQGTDRLPDARQYQLQCAWRANRLHSGGEAIGQEPRHAWHTLCRQHAG